MAIAKYRLYIWVVKWIDCVGKSMRKNVISKIKIDDKMKTCTHKAHELNRRNRTRKKNTHTSTSKFECRSKAALNIYWIFWYHCVWFGCDIYSVKKNFFCSCGWFLHVCIGACAHLYFASFFWSHKIRWIVSFKKQTRKQ